MKILSCEFNMDTACVKLKFDDGSMIAIETIAVQDAFRLQCLNQFLPCFIVCSFLFLLLSCVLVGAPCGIVIEIAASIASERMPHRQLCTPSTVASESGFPVVLFFCLCSFAYRLRKCSGRRSMSLWTPR